MNYPKIRLDKVCRITMGQAPSGDSYNYDSEGLALIAGAGDFGKATPEPKKFTTAAGKKSEKGEIILCIRATIGDLNWSDKEYCLGRGVAGLFGHKDKLDQKYLWHWLKNIAPILKSKGKGATFLQVTKEDICSLEISLPSLSEQHRIASILDKADELRQKRQQAIEKLDQLLQATFIDMFGDPISNPKNWNNCRLEQVTHKITDGTHKTPIYMSSGIEFLSAKDIKNGHIVWDTKKYISEQEHCQLIKRCNPEFGDIVLAKSGSLGSVAVIDRSHQFSLFESLCLIKHDRKKIDALFLTCMLRNPSMLAHLLGKNKGIAIKHLHLVDIRGLQILLPPISLQHEFASRIRAMDKLKSIHSASFESLNSLFKSLQSQAFSGTL